MKVRSRREPLAHSLMFWLLAAMGVAAAVPCLLGQPVEAYRGLLAIEQYEQAAVRRLEARIARQVALKEALRTDPQVNYRLAQRELAYRPLGRLASLGGVGADDVPEALHETPRAEPVELPRWLACLVPRSLAGIYMREGMRKLVLGMSLALIVFALVTYAPRARSARGEQRVE